jgi:hypothetical protein
MADLSAQFVNPYDAFSTLQPENTSPESVSTAAPTWKFEYGAWARLSALRATVSSISRCSGVSDAEDIVVAPVTT